MNRKPLLVQNTAKLVVAEADAGDLGQVLGQAGRRPVREAIPQGEGVGLDGPFHLPEERGSCSGRTPRRLDRVQRLDPTLAIQTPDAVDGVGPAPQALGDRGDRIPCVGHQNNQTVAKNVGRWSPQALAIEFVPLLLGQLDATSHGHLPAAPPPPIKSSDWDRVYESFCVST
jgi:hypothetical protein